MNELFSQLLPTVTLEEMKAVRLMNRIDTKFVTDKSTLGRLIDMAQNDYLVQTIDGLTEMPYYTRYYDTATLDMYMQHLHGHAGRRKVRERRYEHSGTEFLEVKCKNNKGRTDKRRIPTIDLSPSKRDEFLRTVSTYSPDDIFPQIENRFRRITLVNRAMTERLTIDTGLSFRNLVNGITCSLDGLVIIELKRDGHAISPIKGILRTLRVHPSGFSKYCMGMALTDDNTPRNRFKPRLRNLSKMCDIWKI